MARPKIDELKKRIKFKSFRCSIEELQEMSVFCKLHKTSILYLVQRGMNKQGIGKPYPMLKVIKTALYRIGNNINQISHNLNRGNKATKIMAIVRIKELQELKNQLDYLTKVIK